MASGSGQRGCALVTGGSRGIGAAIARGLAADGWPVGVGYRVDSLSAEKVVDSIRSDGGSAVAAGADVRGRSAAETLFSAVEGALGAPVAVLVNNAGVVRDRLVPALDDEAWDEVLATNLTAAFRLTRHALRSMMRERFGRIVNIASVGARFATPGQAAYAASKAGLVALTKTAAAEVARYPITVNAVAPGIVATDATRRLMEEGAERIPARRFGAAEEVAACVSFLASERAAYVTGAVLTVDGGLTA